MIFFKYIITTLCLILLSTQYTSARNYNTIDINPTPSGWNDASAVDVKAVATSVISNLAAYIPEKKFNSIILRNEQEGPKILYKKGSNNENIILVNINGKTWDQLAYQFSHEVCHLLSNYNKYDTKSQWLEESLCEAVSLYTLDKMSIQWQHTPPYPNWKSYSSSIKKYLNNMLYEKHRKKNNDLSKWFVLNKKMIEKNPYLRKKNEVLGTAIYRLMKTGKFNIGTLQYLNLNLSERDKNTSEKLNAWYKNTPKENKKSVLNIATLLGIRI